MTLPRTANVLIVEDDFLLAVTLGAMVEDLGYVVVGPYHTLKDAIDHAGADNFQYALLDFNLGYETDSLPVVEVLAKRGIGYAITSGTDAAIILQAIPTAIILAKPVLESELRSVLHKFWTASSSEFSER